MFTQIRRAAQRLRSFLFQNFAQKGKYSAEEEEEDEDEEDDEEKEEQRGGGSTFRKNSPRWENATYICSNAMG